MASLANGAARSGVADDKAAIRFSNVWLGFEEGPILRGLSFALQQRETLVLLGETGTGKSLTLKLAAGLLIPDQGEIHALGEEVSSKTEAELLEFRRQVGFVFQEGALFDSLSVGENVGYRLEQDRVAEDKIAASVQEVLRFVELEHTAAQVPSELSGGMRRRVSIARALITHPPIVLYDSPTAGLDPITSQTIISLILRLRDTYGVTSLMATHRLQDGFALANFHFDQKTRKVRRDSPVEKSTAANTRFLVLRDGKIYFEGMPEELLHTKDPYLQRFLI
ncbi:MAG TPA: ATP-binding cassette domain-containing protein [Candidatus Saccharimonadales bacterium]|nr:ATP-binding cassette domain-containing protein [Candidatus Saccharimonadales bacterium]